MKTLLATGTLCLLVGCSDDSGPLDPNDELWEQDGPEEPFSSAPGTDPGGPVASIQRALLTSLPPTGWRAMASSATIGFAPRRSPVALWSGTEMFVWGGQLENGSYSNETATYQPDTDTWLMRSPSVLSGRSHAIAVRGDRIYVWGGRNERYRQMSSGGVFNPADGTWFTIPFSPHILKCDPQGVWSPATHEMIVFGCVGDAIVGYTPSGMAYDVQAQTWRELPAAPFPARLGSRVTWADGKMVVYGGADYITRVPRLDGGTFDPVANTWVWINQGVTPAQASTRGGAARAYAGLGLTTGRYFDKASFWGGRPADGATAFDDGGTYTPSAPLASAWTPISAPVAALADSHRRYVSAWYGADRLHIWGGQQYAAPAEREVLDSGASWDPLARTWAALPEGGPTPRAQATAVWNGSETIIWGGWDLLAGTPRLLADGAIYRTPPRNVRAIELDVGFNSSCAVVEDGAVECWGSYSDSADPNADPRRPHVIRDLVAGTDVQLSASLAGTCLLERPTGKVRCQRIDNQRIPLAPTLIDLPLPAVQVSVGVAHLCAVVQDGALYCWGDNTYGQLGIGSFGGQADSPTRVLGIDNATQVSGGWKSTCARLADGTAKCWGSNGESAGLLCNGTTTDSPTPVKVVNLSNIAEIGTHRTNTCARLENGTVHCCGYNVLGELGIGSTNLTANPTPVQVQSLSDATKLSVGHRFTCAVRATGTVVCWGAGFYGRLGNGSEMDRYTPTPVADLADVVQIDTSYGHACARKSSGQVWCWGYNPGGGIGDGTTANRLLPTSVSW